MVGWHGEDCGTPLDPACYSSGVNRDCGHGTCESGEFIYVTLLLHTRGEIIGYFVKIQGEINNWYCAVGLYVTIYYSDFIFFENKRKQQNCRFCRN